MKYKETGIEWLGKIPEHWQHTTIKNHFYVVPSNVDKKIKDNEIAVELCNYVDVYYNDFIDLSVPFMEATAKENEVRKFQLKEKDVLITKDSEDPLDIGVPALITQVKDKLLCGYHLSRLRAKSNKITGDYLFWLLRDNRIASQLWREATGVTRWAIASRHIKNSIIALPPKQEQIATADYLKKACKRIDKIIKIKEQQVSKIQSNYDSKISEIFSYEEGQKSSIREGLDYLGFVPENWKITQLKYVFDFLDNKRIPLSSAVRGVMTEKKFDYYGASGVIDKVDDYIFDEDLLLIGEDGANLFTRTKKLAFIAKGKYWVNNHAHVLKPKFGQIEFWSHLLEHMDYSLFITGSAQPKLSNTNLGKIRLAFPKDEKSRSKILTTIEKLDSLVYKEKKILKNQIKTLKDYRKSLIHECVTGKKQIAKAMETIKN